MFLSARVLNLNALHALYAWVLYMLISLDFFLQFFSLCESCFGGDYFC